jgi:hypothetical protein
MSLRRELLMKKLVVASTSAVVLFAAAPGYAINDSGVPADECSGNPKVVGEPTGVPLFNPGITTSEKVDPPVSANNPGESTGSKGQANSRATTTGKCTG